MKNIRSFANGLRIEPRSSTAADRVGEFEVVSNFLYFHNGTSPIQVVTASQTQTLTNKTFDASTNSLSNITNSNISATAAIALSKLIDGSGLSVPVVAGNASGARSDVIATTDGNILRRNGTALAFGSINLAASGAVGSSVLGLVNGGTGVSGTANQVFGALAPTALKGDLISYDGSVNARLSVGSDGKVLTADSTQTLGIKWATPATGINALSAVGSSPNANAATLTGGTTLNLEAATGSFPGVVTTAAQTLAGLKTLNGGLITGTGGTANATSDSNLGTISSVSFTKFYQGSFSALFNVGWSSSHSITITYQKVGNLVTLTFPSTQFAADNPGTARLAATSASIPSGLIPVSSISIAAVQIVNNGGVDTNTGPFELSSTGLISIYRSMSEAILFTPLTNAGWSGFSVTYNVTV